MQRFEESVSVAFEFEILLAVVDNLFGAWTLYASCPNRMLFTESTISSWIAQCVIDAKIVHCSTLPLQTEKRVKFVFWIKLDQLFSRRYIAIGHGCYVSIKVTKTLNYDYNETKILYKSIVERLKISTI